MSVMRHGAALVIGALLSAAAASAAPERGARMAQADAFHVELFVEGRDLTLYFWNRYEQPIEGDWVRATALVRSSGQTATFDFVPIGESLRAHAPFAVGEKASVTVTFRVLNGPRLRADFSLGSATDSKGHRH